MQFLSENNARRSKYFPVRGKALKLPIYFPSISSVKTGLAPLDYFKILKALQHSHFLVSAFDIAQSTVGNKFIEELQAIRKEDGSIILMDSGNYESFWIRNNNWNIISFNKILNQHVCDLAFSYDNQSPPKNINENVTWIDVSIKNSQAFSETSTIIPIVHCAREVINETILELHHRTHFTMVAIPERILGHGLFERIAAVTDLRKELNKTGNYLYIHLLGTGNPISLLLYSLAGADSFDGLEWCQTVVDSKTALLHHFQQRELIIDDCDFCKASDLDYISATLGHNLAFYKYWMKRIQDAIETDKAVEFLEEYINPNFVSKLKNLWG
jgi:hypothetical protein